MEPPALLALLGTLGLIAALLDPVQPSLSPSPSPSLSPSRSLSLSPSLSLSLSLSAPLSPELGTPFNVTCSSSVRAESFRVTADGVPLSLTLSGDGHRATATVTPTRTGGVRLGCGVRAAGVERNASRTVYVYYVPPPVLNVSSTTPAAGTQLRGQCSLPPGATKDVQVRVLVGDSVLQPWGQAPLAFALPVREEDARLELRCQAGLAQFLRNSSLLIDVWAQPHLDASTCPAQQNWTEGQLGILTCRARGRPKPQVSCSRAGEGGAGDSRDPPEVGVDSWDPPEVGVAVRAHRGHAGTYRCRATNALGTAERDVSVWVQYQDPVPLLPPLLGTLLPALALLGLAGLYLLHRHRTKIGQYWLWRRQTPLELRPPRPPRSPRPPGPLLGSPSGSPGSPQATPNGATAP